MSDVRWARLILELRSAGVQETRVLNALERVPREAFLEPAQAAQAYEDRALPIGCGQTISQPIVVGLMTQALEIAPHHKVLEIGTGSGYQAAVLSQLCRRAYTIERHRQLHTEAEERFKRLGYRNIVSRLGDGWKGWPEQQPFDRIILTAAAPDLPALLVDQLAEDGILVAPLGPEHHTQSLWQFYKDPKKGLVGQKMFPVRFVPMLHGLAAGNRA